MLESDGSQDSQTDGQNQSIGRITSQSDQQFYRIGEFKTKRFSPILLYRENVYILIWFTKKVIDFVHFRRYLPCEAHEDTAHYDLEDEGHTEIKLWVSQLQVRLSH